MNPIEPALIEMKARLKGVENSVKRLQAEVRLNAENVKSEVQALQREVARHTDAMQQEVSRHAANFDQASAEMVDNLQHYQSNIATVVGFLVEEKNQHDAEHVELNRRLEALERKQAS